MQENVFMGKLLPTGMKHERYFNYVSFYRDTENGRVVIGNIPFPYSKKPLAWWLNQLKLILDKK